MLLNTQLFLCKVGFLPYFPVNIHGHMSSGYVSELVVLGITDHWLRDSGKQAS